MNRTLPVMLACLLLSPAAQAQDAAKWPTKPIRMVHGFISGGSVDITARLMAAQMTEALGQQVIVDGRPGAGGTNGAGIVARSNPDGYTLFLMASGHATSPGLYRKLSYDPVDDFTMVSMVASNPMVVLATPSFPPRTMQELVALAKKEPGKINYGTGGVGTGMHLASVLFQARAGVRLNHIPYKGGTAGPNALLAGEIPLLFSTAAGVIHHVKAGRIRPLAVTTKKRFVLWPEVPTIAESVLPDFDVLAWYAVAGPKNVPETIVARLNGVVADALRRQKVADQLLILGAEPRSTSAREAQQFLTAEVARWRKVIRDEGIPPQN